MSVEEARGWMPERRVIDVLSLEVDKDVIIRGNLEVKGTEVVRLTTISYADVEIRGAKQLIVPPGTGAVGFVLRNAEDTEDRVIISEDGLVDGVKLHASQWMSVGGIPKSVPKPTPQNEDKIRLRQGDYLITYDEHTKSIVIRDVRKGIDILRIES